MFRRLAQKLHLSQLLTCLDAVYKRLAKKRCACKLLAYRTRFSRRHSDIYSTLTNTALDLLSVGSTGTACL